MGVYQLGTGVTVTETFTVLGVPTDPTTITFELLLPDSTLATFVFGPDAEVTNPAVGTFLLALAPSDVNQVGHYHYKCEGTGAVLAVSEGDFTILPSSLTDTTALPTFGPCTSWVDSQDVAVCCGSPTTTLGEGSAARTIDADLSQFAVEASQMLFELSGRLFPGVCAKTVRPCSSRGCGFFQLLSRGHIVWDPTLPYGDGYGWWGAGWWWNGQAPCGCTPLDRVVLSGYPVREITEVLIDGAVVDPTTYRLDERRYLTRVRDPLAPTVPLFWPACQLLDLDDTQVGTWSVSYLYGVDPPILGQHAAAQLACEIYKQCAGDECLLPSSATRVTRQGVTIERQFFQLDKRIGAWRTGLAMVDAFLNTYASAGLKRRPIFWSPLKSRRYPRPVGSNVPGT